MPTQLVLAWEIDVSNTSLGPAGAATMLGNVPLYANAATDPVLGQLFNLDVASDVSAPSGATTATRTLTLNMQSGGQKIFPCHPNTSTPPAPSYPILTTKTLPGSFFVVNGSMSVTTSASQIPSLSIGDQVQFLSQEGVFYTIASVGATTIGLTAPYAGVTSNTVAFKEVPAPITLGAVYSSSDFDTDGVATVPAISPGSGARSVAVAYFDSTGAFFFSPTFSLTGRRPAAIPLALGSVDIAAISGVFIVSAGSFGDAVGQITLVGLSSALPIIPPDATPVDFLGALTDEAQLLIDQAITYAPPSYFALAQQGASAPYLAGDFILTTGSKNVPTSVDQTGVLAHGNTIQFAEQLADNPRKA